MVQNWVDVILFAKILEQSLPLFRYFRISMVSK